MTLHAEIHPQLRTQPGWIHDARANLFAARARGLRRANVTSARAMTPLAVDAFGKVAAKDRLATGSIVSGWNSRVAVMAKNAFIGHQPAGGRMPRIEPRTHPPRAALFRIPAERQLDECSSRRAMEIGACVGAGAGHVVDLGLFDVRREEHS